MTGWSATARPAGARDLGHCGQLKSSEPILTRRNRVRLVPSAEDPD
jgi:hypothetical protein